MLAGCNPHWVKGSLAFIYEIVYYYIETVVKQLLNWIPDQIRNDTRCKFSNISKNS